MKYEKMLWIVYKQWKTEQHIVGVLFATIPLLNMNEIKGECVEY